MILAITGGTGFVGEHLLRHAGAAGHQRRALTRRARRSEDGLTWIEGSVPHGCIAGGTGPDRAWASRTGSEWRGQIEVHCVLA